MNIGILLTARINYGCLMLLTVFIGLAEKFPKGRLERQVAFKIVERNWNTQSELENNTLLSSTNSNYRQRLPTSCVSCYNGCLMRKYAHLKNVNVRTMLLVNNNLLI